MLDQNTDRMWYVIGAVIVGAALILLMNGTFPELFASVGETFEAKTEDVTEMTDGIRPKRNEVFLMQDLLKESDIRVTHTTTIDTSEFKDSGTVHITQGDDPYAGIRFLARDLALAPSTDYIFSYDYQKTGGELVSFGGHTHDIFTNAEVYVNGVKRDMGYMDDNSVFVDNSTDVQHVEVHFTTPDTIDVDPTGSYWDSVHDAIAIQPNRANMTPVNVSIYHLRLVKKAE